MTNPNRACQHCESTNVKSKGIRKTSKGDVRRFHCHDCGRESRVLLSLLENVETTAVEDQKPKLKMIEPYLDFRKEYPDAKGLVVTCATNDTGINKPFLASLEAYCDSKDFQLLIIPVKYMNPSAMNMSDDTAWPKEVDQYLFRRTYTVDKVLKVIGDCNIQATATHPLTGIDGLTDGMTTIVGHPVVQMKTLPVNEWRDPIILHSTGSVSLKNNYSASKAGYRASYHHCFAAVTIEFDKDKKFHIRQLMADATGGFYDLCDYWGSKGYERTDRADALVLGDEHVVVGDSKAYEATFGSGGMVDILKPKYLVRHDVFDAQSCGKHDVNNFFNRFRKHTLNVNSVECELKQTVQHLVDSTPKTVVSLIVDSNHSDHLGQWLGSYGEPKSDYINAEIYHNLMWRCLSDIKKGCNRSPFQIYVEDIFGVDKDRVQFMTDGFELSGIVLSMHGHRGSGGSRGSITNLSKIGEKSVIGHGHSPGIQAGCWQVGTLSRKDLDYVKGSPSGWLHTNCVIYPNGKRQLISSIAGCWRHQPNGLST